MFNNPVRRERHRIGTMISNSYQLLNAGNDALPEVEISITDSDASYHDDDLNDLKNLTPHELKSLKSIGGMINRAKKPNQKRDKFLMSMETVKRSLLLFNPDGTFYQYWNLINAFIIVRNYG